MRKAGFIYQSGFGFCFYLMWYLLVGPSMKLHNCSFWGLYFMVIIEGKKVLICFLRLIIYLTFQHRCSPNCELYKKPSCNMSFCEFITENFFTITGITPNQTLTLTIQTDPRWRLSNYKAWCSLLIKRFISNCFFLLHVQCEGPMLLRVGWVTPEMLQTESFFYKSSGFHWFKNKWWWIQSTSWPRQLSRLKQRLPNKASKRAASFFITCNSDPASRAVCCIAQNQA